MPVVLLVPALVLGVLAVVIRHSERIVVDDLAALHEATARLSGLRSATAALADETEQAQRSHERLTGA